MFELLDYRRTVSDMYGLIRHNGTAAPDSFTTFKTTRDQLFGNHSQSALDPTQRENFAGLNYYDYDSAYYVVGQLNHDVEPITYPMELGKDGSFVMKQVAEVSFTLPTGTGQLGVFWIEGYGGGIFLPFRDSTNGKTTYGGGRYLYDTIKGADLGTTATAMVLDFNYAYHPSCYYNERWVCPLAPPNNRLAFAIPTGEQLLETIQGS